MKDRPLVNQHYEPMTQCLDVQDPVWKAWRTMKDQKIRRLPVKKKGKIVGIVSDRDIVQISSFNGGQSMPVKEAMTLDPLVISCEMDIAEALREMLRKDQHHAIVIDGDREVCGLFSWDKAFALFLKYLETNLLKKSVS